MDENEVQETEATTETTTEVPETQKVNTNDAINASLDEIDDVDSLKEMVKKLRRENADKRTKTRETKAELEEFRAWRESQMTELEKTQAQLNEVKGLLHQTEIDKIKLEFDLTEDDIELVADDDLDRMRAKATKLAARTKQATTETAPAKVNLHPGTRGNPVVAGEASMEEAMTKWLRNQL